MPDEFERYAVYWVPGRTDDLAHFGCSWMGWCAERGELRPREATSGLSADIAAATRAISRHGFHGVIQAPFRLRSGRSRWSVENALRLAADQLVAVPLPTLELAVIAGRVALVPDRPDPALARAVARIEDGVGPLAADAPRALRPAASRSAGGTERLQQLPASPAHRFHLPLTDRVDLGTAFRIRAELARRLQPLLDGPHRLTDLALMGDPGGGRPFRVLQRFDLRETPARRGAAVLPCVGPQTLVPMPPPGRLQKTEVAV